MSKRRLVTAAQLLLLSLFCAVVPLAGQDLHTWTDRDSVQAGETLRLILVLQQDREYSSVVLPGEEYFEDSDEIEFLSREHHRISARRDSLVFHLQFFGVEDENLPSLPVMLIDSEGDTSKIESLSVPLFFRSAISEEDNEFRPFKPIFDFAVSIWPWILLLAILCLIAWQIRARIWNRGQRPEPQEPREPEPYRDPIKELEENLTLLRGAGSPLSNRDFDRFYTELGDAIRLYFERVYLMDALEMTSREIWNELNRLPAEKELTEMTRKVLNEADMVKFARFTPDREQALASLRTGEQFLETAARIDHNRIVSLRTEHEKRELERMDDKTSKSDNQI
ncbi:MAG: hypothetical protein WDZ29_04625 [Balneolaceae bacterium]